MARHHLLGEGPFSRLLIAERKRADRTNQPCAVLVIAATRRWPRRSAASWQATIDALSACLRDTDVVGWLERHARMGVILHDIQPAIATDPSILELRIRGTLLRSMPPDAVARVTIRLFVHRPCGAAQEPPRADEDPYARPRLHPSLETTPFYERIKRVVDVVGSITLLALLLPLLLIVAALVKVKSPGPVFFAQVRLGRQMKSFRMLKFRTMHVNADHGLHQEFVRKFIHSEAASNAGIFKIVDDPRVTPIGRILRKTSIDELPQLLNVLRGEMSLVGPRPPLPYEVEQYKPWHTLRVIDAKPGLTGLWQVGGRSRTTFDDMVRLDLQYAKQCSLWTDVKILLATPRAVFSGRGAC